MKWIFPIIKTTRTIEQQLQKVEDEIEEYKTAKDETNRDEEAVDLLHSVETFLRLRFQGREEQLNTLIESVILKNKSRNYYENECY